MYDSDPDSDSDLLSVSGSSIVTTAPIASKGTMIARLPEVPEQQPYNQ